MTPFTIKDNLARNVCEAAKQLDVIKPHWARATELTYKDIESLTDGIVRTVFRKELENIRNTTDKWHAGMRMWYADYNHNTWPLRSNSMPHSIWNFSQLEHKQQWKTEILARQDNPEAYYQHIEQQKPIVSVEHTCKYTLTIKGIVIELTQEEYDQVRDSLS